MDKAADEIRFDLPNGSVRAGGDERVVLVPCSAIDELGKHAKSDSGVDPAAAFCHAIGEVLGQRIAARLGSSDAVRSASLETFVNALAGELAVAGWGTVSLERWGRAMVLLVEHSPLNEHRCLAALFEGALSAATGREARCASLGVAKDGGVRILVGAQRAVVRVRDWLAHGVAWGDALARLQNASDEGRA
jgi:hypothetical protein